MKPGLQRAVPAGILGALGGALFVILLRWAQSVDPIWDAEIGGLMAVLTGAAAFVWGAGAADPRSNQHPHEPEADEYGLIVVDEDEEEHDHADDDLEEFEREPRRVLGFSIWQVSFWTFVLFVVVFGFATLPGGFFLQTSNDPSASTADVGFETTIQLPFDGPEVQVSQLTLFIGLAVFTIVSLLAVGGLIAGLFQLLSRGTTEAKELEPEPLERTMSQTVAYRTTPDARRIRTLEIAYFVIFTVVMWFLSQVILPALVDWEHWVIAPVSLAITLAVTVPLLRPVYARQNAVPALNEAALFAGVFLFMHWLFYYILIGFVVYSSEGIWPALRVILSLANAALVGALLAYPAWIARFVGTSARGAARALRGLPDALN